MFSTEKVWFLITLMLMSITGVALAQPKNCREQYLYGSSTAPIIEHWASDSSDPLCLVVIAGETGTLNVTGGWVYDAPLKLDGIEIETYNDPDQNATQISPFTREMNMGNSFMLVPTWRESGTEIGLWFTFIVPEPTPTAEPSPTPPATATPLPEEPECEQETILEEADTIFHSWGDSSDHCIEVLFPNAGNFEITGGWVFGTPFLNGNLYPTFDAGELALKLVPTIYEVQAGETHMWLVEGYQKGTEIGINYVFTNKEDPVEEGEHHVLLPLIFVPPPPPPEPVVESVSVQSASTNFPIKKSWFGLEDDQQVCLKVNFTAGGSAVWESGWFFGTHLSASHNDQLLNVLQTPNGGATGLLGLGNEIRLENAGSLLVCVLPNAENNAEIGLRLKYPG